MTRLDELVDLLEKMGPLDAYEISHEMGIRRQNIDTLIRRARKKGQPKRIYISKWLVAPEVKMQTRLWMAGNKPDAPKPSYSKRAAGNRSDQRRRAGEKMIARLKAHAGNPFAIAMNQILQEAA